MKKTIATLALMASTTTSAFAMPMPRDPNEPAPTPPVIRTICLNTYEKFKDGSLEVGSCDMVDVNERDENGKTKKNGCPKGQVAIKTADVEISACPTAAQL